MEIIFDKSTNTFNGYNITDLDKNAYYLKFVYDNKLYYFKRTGFDNLERELIGPFITRYFTLDSCNNYPIFTSNNIKGILSQDVFNDNIHHSFPFYFGDDIRDIFKLIKLNDHEKDTKVLIFKILKMIIRDYSINYQDRHKGNFAVIENSDYFDLPPLFDYDFDARRSYPIEIIGVEKNYFDFNINLIKEYLELFPQLEILINLLLKINIKKIIKEVEDTYKLKIRKETRSEYIEIINKSKKDMRLALK